MLLNISTSHKTVYVFDYILGYFGLFQDFFFCQEFKVLSFLLWFQSFTGGFVNRVFFFLI